MAALDYCLHANLLKIKLEQVAGINRSAISEPEHQEQEHPQWRGRKFAEGS